MNNNSILLLTTTDILYFYSCKQPHGSTMTDASSIYVLKFLLPFKICCLFNTTVYHQFIFLYVTNVNYCKVSFSNESFL